MLPVTSCHIFGLSLIFSVVLAGIIMLYYLVKKYKTVKKTKIIRYLILTIIPLFAAIAVDPTVFIISRFFSTIEQATPFIIAFTNISFACTAVANLRFAMFIKLVFYEEDTNVLWERVVIAIEACVAVLLVLCAFIKLEYIELIVLLVHVAVSLILYIFQSVKAFGLVKKTSDKLVINSLKSIGYSGILLVSAFTLFIIQEIMTILEIKGLFDEQGCSFFIPLGWFLAFFAAFAIFVGYYVPGWAKRRWTK